MEPVSAGCFPLANNEARRNFTVRKLPDMMSALEEEGRHGKVVVVREVV